MFSLKDKLTFININQDYLKYLHEECPEVYYKPICYDNKPYLGILINNEGQEYVIPISSAKKKHESSKRASKTESLSPRCRQPLCCHFLFRKESRTSLPLRVPGR